MSLVSVGGVAAFAGISLKTQIKSVSIGAKDDRIAESTSIGAIEGGANILLVGSDTRVGQTDVAAGVADGSRNDVTILIHLSADHTQMTAVSFPRDLMVDLPSCTGTNGATFPAADYQQFNTSLGEGLGCTVATVESMTGLTIPYAAEITFDGVIEMSNAIGGVDVCVARPIDDSDSGLVLSAGTHTLQGLQALEFLRTRHGVGDGSDLARISSQQVFLSAMMRKIVSSGTLGNPVKLYGLASAAVKNMTLSKSLGDTDTMVELGLALKGIDLSKVLFVQYPTATDPENSNRVVADESSATILNADLKSDTKFTLGANSTGRASAAEGSSGTASSGTTSSGTTSSGTAGGTASGSAGSGTAATSSPTATPSSSATSSPAATSSTLPSTITGQAASEATCSVGNG
ncbi:LCP family protein [Frondihabitans peucedani]|uniref:LCP family protein n=1 Tax=Frondihabitans peucedani TaxID=598626 RepID=A0ABP8E2G3_9MICO